MNPCYDTTNVRLLINYIILIIIKCHRFKKLYICDGKTAEERLLKEILNVSLPSPVVQDVGAFGSEASQNFARSNHSIWDGHDLSVCEANAAKKREATKKTKGLVSTNNYLTQDIMPRETDPLCCVSIYFVPSGVSIHRETLLALSDKQDQFSLNHDADWSPLF